MDYRNANMSWQWQWQGDDYLIQTDVNLDLPKCGRNGITQNEVDDPYLFEAKTPAKACGESTHHFNDFDIMTKRPHDREDFSPPSKRRRVLDFDNVNEDILSSSLKSKERLDAIDDFLSEISRWEDCLQGFEDLSQSEAWLADCLDVTSLNNNSNDGNGYISSQTSSAEVCSNVLDSAPNMAPVFSEVCSNALDSAPDVAQRAVRSSRNVIFRGRRSYMRAPPKLGSSIAYPFEFIKPCSIRGDVTLKDINQRIHTPPLKLKEVPEDPPISAFSGKPVVGKTTIPTQGGKGSITIMRTKG